MDEQRAAVPGTVWAATSATEAALELDESTPAKVCKRMRSVTFDDMAEPGMDLGTSWRELLIREGKYDPEAESLRDLVGVPDLRPGDSIPPRS
jgi:hypothetical protein